MTFSFRRVRQNLVCISALPYALHMPAPPHSPRFNHPRNILWGARIITLLIMLSPPVPCYFVPLRSKHLPQHPILEHLNLWSSLMWSFTPIQNNRQNNTYVNIIFILLIGDKNATDFVPNGSRHSHGNTAINLALCLLSASHCKSMHFVHSQHSWVSHGVHNTQPLFPPTALTDWSLSRTCSVC